MTKLKLIDITFKFFHIVYLIKMPFTKLVKRKFKIMSGLVELEILEFKIYQIKKFIKHLKENLNKDCLLMKILNI